MAVVEREVLEDDRGRLAEAASAVAHIRRVTSVLVVKAGEGHGPGQHQVEVVELLAEGYVGLGEVGDLGEGHDQAKDISDEEAHGPRTQYLSTEGTGFPRRPETPTTGQPWCLRHNAYLYAR